MKKMKFNLGEPLIHNGEKYKIVRITEEHAELEGFSGRCFLNPYGYYSERHWSNKTTLEEWVESIQPQKTKNPKITFRMYTSSKWIELDSNADIEQYLHSNKMRELKNYLHQKFPEVDMMVSINPYAHHCTQISLHINGQPMLGSDGYRSFLDEVAEVIGWYSGEQCGVYGVYARPAQEQTVDMAMNHTGNITNYLK